MATLHLGVIDIPHTNQLPTKAPGKGHNSSGLTTGDLAEILEAKYGIMAEFVALHGDDIAAELEKSVADALDSVLLGAPLAADPFAAATGRIEEIFKTEFLDLKQMDGRVPGVPTLASLEGVSQRFKCRRGPPRPSFIDSGQFSASIKAWVDSR